MRLYREFATQDELDREYNPSAALPAATAITERWSAASQEVVASRPDDLDVRYGPSRAETVDIFRAGAGAPVHIFIHGGYWRRFAARDFAFLAPAFNRAGLTLVNVNYALCPAVTIDEIVREVRAAIAWTWREIAAFDGDATKLTVSGHSAGGHLVGAALATDWPGEYDLPADIIKGAVPISGLFDLAPFPFTYLQPAIQLTWDQIRRNSPIGMPARATGPVVVAVGGAESAEFRRQSQTYTDGQRAAGIDARYFEAAGRNHFDILDDLGDGGPLLQAISRMAGLG